jgi:Flp pilus assembly protein TadD
VFAQRVKLCKLKGDQAGAEIAAKRAAVGAEWTPEDHHLAGTKKLGEGKYAEALTHFRAALKMDATLYWTHLGEGACHDEPGRLADGGAQVVYQVAAISARVAATDPTYVPRAVDLASVALRAGFGRGHLAADADFAAVRSDPGFHELAGK